MAGGYTSEQLLKAVKGNFVTFVDFMEDGPSSVADARLHLHIDRLLINIYVHYKEGRQISKMQACRLIPADHIDTCKKYVAEAERQGLVQFLKDEHDGRRVNVVPTERLIAHIEKRASMSLDMATDIAQDQNPSAH